LALFEFGRHRLTEAGGLAAKQEAPRADAAGAGSADQSRRGRPA